MRKRPWWLFGIVIGLSVGLTSMPEVSFANNVVRTALVQGQVLNDATDQLDLSKYELSHGQYLNIVYPNRHEEDYKKLAQTSVKVKLAPQTRYYFYGDAFHHVTVKDSIGHVVYDHRTSIYNEEVYDYFVSDSAGTYTITYDEYDKTLIGSWGFGSAETKLKLFEVLDNVDSDEIIDLDQPSIHDDYAFVVDSRKTDQLGITTIGDNNQSGKYDVWDTLWYYPVIGYKLIADIERYGASYSGQMSGEAGSFKKAPGLDIQGDQVHHDEIHIKPSVGAHGQIKVHTKLHHIKNGHALLNKMQHLNFWNRFKSFLGDPVDTYSGGFVDQRTLMTYGGNNPLHYDISYNSIAEGQGHLAEGYVDNFDSKLVKDDQGVHVYWSPDTVSDFQYHADLDKYIAVDARQHAIQVKVLEDGYEIDNPEDGIYHFNQSGQLLSKTDKVGQVTNYEYAQNDLVKVSNDRGQYFKFTYDTNHTIIKVTNGLGDSIDLDYGYDGSHRHLNHIIFGNKKEMLMTYNKTDLTSLKYDGQQLINNSYDEYGRIVKQVNGDQTVATYDYSELADDQLKTIYTVDGKSVTSIHDSDGNLLSQTDANGHKTTYDYNANNQQIAKTDATGAKSTYRYDDANHVITQTDALGQSTNYGYDQNNLTTLATPDGASAKLAYDDQGRLASSTDKSGLQTTYQYDKFGNPTVIEKVKDGKVYSHAENQYDENGYLIATIVNGKKTSFTNDALGRKITETMPSGTVMHFTYDDNNNVLTSSVGDKTTTFEYDSLGNITKKTLPNGHVTTYTYENQQLQSVKTHSDDSLTQNYNYNSAGLLSSISVGDDTVVAYGYDDAGNVITSTNYNNKQTTIGYDAANRQVSATLGDATTKTTYNADGQITSTTTGNGNTTSYDYDASGNIIKETLPDGTIVENTYDVMGHLLSRKTNGKTVTYEYDALGNRTSMTDAAGNKTSYTYNADGQVLSSTNALGHKTSYVYNDNGQLTQTLNNRGEVTTKYSYDDAGNVISVSNSQHVMRTMTYDANNNLLTVKDANGDLVSQTELNSDEQVISTINALNSKSGVDYSYNNSQTTVTTTNALGHKQSTTTDYGGNVIKSRDDVTSGMADYNEAGNLANQSVNDGQNKTSLTYDKDQNVVSEVNNDSSESYSYDALDQLSSWTNARGDKTTYTRDADGNITNTKASDVDNNYGYDVNGNETSAKNSNADISKTYDALNRVVSKTQNGQTIKYNYDDREFLTDLIYPGDKKVHYDVNTDGQITAMTDWNNHKTTYDYDKNGWVVKTTNWNGVIEERSYNTAGQVLTIKTSLHDKTLTDYKYTYDSDGNLIKDGSQVAYQYDKLNRLLKGQGNYTYDAVGNITASGNHKMTYDDDSRLTSIDDNKTSIDKDGNLTSYTMGGKNHTASYNSQNQLTKYDDLWYTYDADGNRVSAGSDHFIYDDNGHLLSDGVNTYVYGASGVVGYYNKDGKFVTYLFNQRGDIVEETDESGSVTNSFDYNDYGKLIGSDKAADSVFGYGGQYGAVTDKNGLVFLQTRYYNPEIMRFMNRDTVRGSITDTKSLNRFAYVEGNPLTYVDPNGQAATWLKNNLDSLHSVLSDLSFIPGFNIAASIGMMTIDLAKHDYTALVLDSMGVVVPGIRVGARLGYDGVRAIVDGLKVSDSVANFSVRFSNQVVRVVDNYKSFQSSGNQLALATGFVDNSSSRYSKSIEKISQSDSVASSHNVVNIKDGKSFKNDSFNEYLNDLQLQTGRKITDIQAHELQKHLNGDQQYLYVGKVKTAANRRVFNRKKAELINEWEQKTGETWPTYSEAYITKSGNEYKSVGDPFDAHHLIENSYDGDAEWWNIFPAKFPTEHQAGIHRKDGPASVLFK